MMKINKRITEWLSKLRSRGRYPWMKNPENRIKLEASLEQQRKLNPPGHFRRFWVAYALGLVIVVLAGTMWWQELGPGANAHMIDKSVYGAANEVSLMTIEGDIRSAPKPKLIRLEAYLEKTEGKPARPMVLCQCGYDRTEGTAPGTPKELETAGVHLYKAVLTDPLAFSDLRHLVEERGGDVQGDGALVLAQATTLNAGDSGWSTGNIVNVGLTAVIALAIVMSVIMQYRSGGRLGGLTGTSKAKGLRQYNPDDTAEGLEGIGGNPEYVQFLRTLVLLLKEAPAFLELGGEMPTGFLLVGPPGTGKTDGMRKVAKEAKVPFFVISGSDFVEMFVGVGASRVRDMFATVRQNLPCILFVDELDALGRMRGAGHGGGNDEREQTLNQLLVEMDGIATERGVVLVGATNRPDVLDTALKDRFNKIYEVVAPDQDGRCQILEIKKSKPKLKEAFGPDVDLKVIARETRGMTGRGLHKLMNTAAIMEAIKRLGRMPKPGELTQVDLLTAIEALQLGDDVASKVMPYHVQVRTGFHEGCHAAVMIYLHKVSLLLQEAGLLAKDAFYSAKVSHATITGKSNGAGGVTQGAPDEELFGPGATYHAMIGMLIAAVAGRAGELHFMGGVSSGHSGDWQAITKIASQMVMKLSMSAFAQRSLVIPPFAIGSDSRKNPFLGAELGMGGNEHFESDKSKEQIMSETGALAFAAALAADVIIKREIAFILAITQELLAKEKLREQEIEDLWAKYGSKDPMQGREEWQCFFDNPRAKRNILEARVKQRKEGDKPLRFTLDQEDPHRKAIEELHAQPAGKRRKVSTSIVG